MTDCKKREWVPLTNEGVADLAREALDAACLVIQDRLQVDAGDWAAQIFSDHKVEELFEAYIRFEMRELAERIMTIAAGGDR